MKIKAVPMMITLNFKSLFQKKKPGQARRCATTLNLMMDSYLVDDTFSGPPDISQQPLSSVDLPLDSWMGLCAADFSDYVFF